MLSFPLILTFFGALFATASNKNLGTLGFRAFILVNMLMSCVFSYFLFFETAVEQTIVTFTFAPWLDFFWGGFSWGLWFDSVAALMFVTVCTVSTAVHFYSCYYMEMDPYFRRFLVYLTLFTFFMLFLISADNLLQLFFGWEGVGLCSYLLINFWYTRPQANKSALKAIIMNRVGDCGFLFAIVMIIAEFGGNEFQTLFSRLAFVTPALYGELFSSIDVICFFLFVGVMAKSAQIGLHTWLPDAMEGPTPVSALIHAATMVTAGIYLMIRTAPLFECSPTVLVFAAFIGGLTALFAASVALTQHDLKKVIAYSTCSQLGYMVMACGVSNFALAFFHLVNHAFFKALLFVGAGTVIHCFGGEQDVRKMGGLYNIFPIGGATMSVASFSLAGLPFLSGFYSKDLILGSLLVHGTVLGNLLWCLGVLAAICTSVYSAGLAYFIFFGEPRGSYMQYKNLHSIPFLATMPMLFLGVFSVVSGFYLRDLLVGPGSVMYFSQLALFTNTSIIADSAEWLPLWAKLIPLSAGLSGFIYYTITNVRGLGPLTGVYFPGWLVVYKFLFYRWYWDALYNYYIAWPVYRWSYRVVYRVFDKGFVEGLGLNFATGLAVRVSQLISTAQAGDLRVYLSWTLLGFLLTWEFGLFYGFSMF